VDEAAPVERVAVPGLGGSEFATADRAGVLVLLMRVGRLIIRAQTLGAAEEAEVFAFARDRDPRVRQLALNAAGLASRRGSSSVLEAAVIAGLYDPAEDVLLRAL